MRLASRARYASVGCASCTCAAIALLACSKAPPRLTEPEALEAANVREEKLARIAAVVREATVGKKTRGEGSTKQIQRDDEARRVKELRADLQKAADAVVGEVGALGLRITMLRPVPDRPQLADKEKAVIGTVVVPPCVPDGVGVKTAVVADKTIEYGSFKVRWADDTGTHGDDKYHPGIAVTRRIYFGAGTQVPLEKSAAHVPADLELAITACFLTDGTPRP